MAESNAARSSRVVLVLLALSTLFSCVLPSRVFLDEVGVAAADGLSPVYDDSVLAFSRRRMRPCPTISRLNTLSDRPGILAHLVRGSQDRSTFPNISMIS